MTARDRAGRFSCHEKTALVGERKPTLAFLRVSSMIAPAVLGIAFLFFVVVAYFSAQTWKVGQVVAVVALFLFTMVFLVLAAATLRTHGRWRQAYEQEAEALAAARERHQQLRFGDPAEDEDSESLRGLASLAERQLLDRGRVWRNVRVASLNPDAIVLNMVGWTNDNCLRVGEEELGPDEVPAPIPDEGLENPPDGVPPEAAPGEAAGPATPVAAGPSHRIAPEAIVYAFKEYPIATLSPVEKQLFFANVTGGDENFADQDRRGLCRVPLVYMGKFRVVQANEQAVSLAAMIPLEESQMQLLDPRTPGTWALYEQLPRDDHETFAALTPEKLQAVFSPQRMEQLIGIRLARPRYEQMVQQYLRDLREALPDDPPQRTWLEVRFTRPHVVPVDLDVEGPLPAADRPFTPDGRAQTPALVQKGPSVFARQGDEPGEDAADTALLDFASGDQLIRAGTAELVRRVFVRPLHDYQGFFNSSHADRLRVGDQISVAQRDKNALDAAAAEVNELREKYRAERERLSQDLAGYRREIQVLQGYLQALNRRYDRIRSEVNRRYLSAVSQPSPISAN
jgi:hypothetical protein